MSNIWNELGVQVHISFPEELFWQVLMLLCVFMSADIDECAEGLIVCHNHSRCVNLPGWYHCECRSGFHDNGSYQLDGSSCIGEQTVENIICPAADTISPSPSVLLIVLTVRVPQSFWKLHYCCCLSRHMKPLHMESYWDHLLTLIHFNNRKFIFQAYLQTSHFSAKFAV